MPKRLSTAQRHVKTKRRIHVHVSNASVAGVSSYHAAISKYCSNICFNAAQSGMTREAYLELKEIEKADPRESMHLCVGIGGKTCGRLIPAGFRRCPECWKKLRGSSEVDDTLEYEILGQA